MADRQKPKRPTKPPEGSTGDKRTAQQAMTELRTIKVNPDDVPW